MKIARAVLLVLFLTSSFVVMASTQALACSCVPPRPDDKAIKDAAAVFSGTVVDTEDGAEIGFDRVTWTFAVDTVYKSLAVNENQDVTSHTQSAACGVVFKEEKRYVVFAYEEAGELQTNSCTNTRPLAEGKELDLEPVAEFVPTDAMGPKSDLHRDREDESANVIPFVAAGAAVGAVILLAALLLRRRRSTPP